jgi:phosphatidylserine/phosphatidylglycerophosphate/cardiolipin synthase-like enzyme
MRANGNNGGLAVQVVAGVHSVILGIDLDDKKRAGCLGFSIQRSDLGPKGQPVPADRRQVRWLPNLLRFPSDTNDKDVRTDRAPLQKFRWGDYTTDPAHTYRYRVVARFGKPGQLTDGPAVEVEVTAEDPASDDTAVFFNRAAAASRAFDVKFPTIKKEEQLLGKSEAGRAARTWLSRGLEEALLAFLQRATGDRFALHAAVYEFQKPNLLDGLKQAVDRGVDVRVAYHARVSPTELKEKKGPKKKPPTADKNEAAAKKAGLTRFCVKRAADPQGAIMHDKFVVLLEKQGGGGLKPVAVWTGSTNWTDGGVYGQLNVGHAIFDAGVAAQYEACFQLLHGDAKAPALKKALATINPVPKQAPPGRGTHPIFSPQTGLAMISLYAEICRGAKLLLVCAPFELHQQIRDAFRKSPKGTAHYLLLDTKKALGKPEEVKVQEGDPSNVVAAATTLPSALHDAQGHMLEGTEGFLHRGIHIHSKIILADPFGPDPILVTGSANYSTSSTNKNDSNSLLIRGNTAVADIYATEFMRMFEHYHFRGSVAKEKKKQPKPKRGGAASNRSKKKSDADADVLTLKETDAWQADYYDPKNIRSLDRQLFAGTLK